ncbi:MAG: hypothetical protein JST58_13770 [Bacteroidetes bacterium]|nr:hypothetical protein [Bacteroidota bacterium]
MRYLIFPFFLFVGYRGIAQDQEALVKATVNQLFLAMKNSDSALLVSCFAQNAILQTIEEKKDAGSFIKNEKVRDFASVIGKLPKTDADEQIVFDIVKVDGPLAVVWAPYKFYYKGKLSHCGVDSFQLLYENGFWKIQYLIDTRRKQGCE